MKWVIDPHHYYGYWGQKSICSKINLNQFNQKCLKFYLWNHKFNVFKRFWKRNIKCFFAGSKSLIKAQKSGKNRKNQILAPFLPRLRDLGVIIVGINEAHVHTYFGHFSLVFSSFISSCCFWPFLTELAVLAETGRNMAEWLFICS